MISQTFSFLSSGMNLERLSFWEISERNQETALNICVTLYHNLLQKLLKPVPHIGIVIHAAGESACWINLLRVRIKLGDYEKGWLNRLAHRAGISLPLHIGRTTHLFSKICSFTLPENLLSITLNGYSKAAYWTSKRLTAPTKIHLNSFWIKIPKFYVSDIL